VAPATGFCCLGPKDGRVFCAIPEEQEGPQSLISPPLAFGTGNKKMRCPCHPVRYGHRAFFKDDGTFDSGRLRAVGVHEAMHVKQYNRGIRHSLAILESEAYNASLMNRWRCNIGAVVVDRTIDRYNEYADVLGFHHWSLF
jgi:hypothetical protein